MAIIEKIGRSDADGMLWAVSYTMSYEATWKYIRWIREPGNIELDYTLRNLFPFPSEPVEDRITISARMGSNRVVINLMNIHKGLPDNVDELVLDHVDKFFFKYIEPKPCSSFTSMLVDNTHENSRKYTCTKR